MPENSSARKRAHAEIAENQEQISEKTTPVKIPKSSNEQKSRKIKFKSFKEEVGEITEGSYHGIRIYIHKPTGWINATHLAAQFGENFAQHKRKVERFKKFYQAFIQEYGPDTTPVILPGSSKEQYIEELNAGISAAHSFLRGFYVDPRMTNKQPEKTDKQEKTGSCDFAGTNKQPGFLLNKPLFKNIFLR